MNTPTNKPPGTPEPVEIPDLEFEEFLEWTTEEEEAFLKIVDDRDGEAI
jgi:hypothetical protein